MRKIFEALSLGVLGLLWWATIQAIYGGEPLPARIPTHFDAAGTANGWGPPQMLFILPVGALVLYLGFTRATSARAQQSFKISGVRVTDENRPRLVALILQMLTLVKAEILGLFVWVQFAILDAVRNPDQAFQPIKNLIPACVVVIGATVISFMVVISRAARPQE
jgi:uncharacterized membrane protein